MNPTQLPFLVQAFLILATMTLGFFIGRKGKPYGKVKLVFHLFFFLWLSVGFAFIGYGLLVASVTTITWILIACIGLMMLTQLTTGIVMLASKIPGKAVPMIHTISAILVLVADVCAFFATASSTGA